MATEVSAESQIKPVSTAVESENTIAQPVEMSSLPSDATASAEPITSTTESPPSSQIPPQSTDNTTTALSSTSNEPSTSEQITPTQPQSSQPEHPALTRQQTEALGLAADDDEAPALPSSLGTSSAIPILHITLQLISGARHPYKIDQKYLTARKVDPRNPADDTFDPTQLSGYKLKELIWTDWRNEWEPKPSSPSSIRLIRAGKLIEDKKVLGDYNLSLAESNFIQMTVKPADFDNDDEAGASKGGKGSGTLRQRDGGESDAGCRCVIL